MDANGDFLALGFPILEHIIKAYFRAFSNCSTCLATPSGVDEVELKPRDPGRECHLQESWLANPPRVQSGSPGTPLGQPQHNQEGRPTVVPAHAKKESRPHGAVRPGRPASIQDMCPMPILTTPLLGCPPPTSDNTASQPDVQRAHRPCSEA
ncbi:hypothetical protein PGT21_008032 [Puccinia graminis f. sp. tritici]|uniref:Uncharacterized protein n=1 Tax=Puccinia graminis f. sp. tritici TaxID=56615 RepID=A0A5B0MCX0_PUCGR|nr:hypothetical protein PGT21_008032 [Puccinia graminis f. sp. tritici]KAA1116074.1 hypothetical protein PGTUg99_034302 [Puccinia graminis f. sp. tritici]